jgi:uracil-DNA glycosylase family 4
MGKDLTQLPVFGPGHANCKTCELRENCDKGKTTTAHRPKNFNGIMIVGEGPGAEEILKQRPFVGRSGKLLRALFDSYNVDMDDCYITNATLCFPPRFQGDGKKKTGLHDRFPNAVYSCLSRLEAEIAAVRPRVVLAFGAAALIAMTGYEETFQRQRPFACDNCDPDRKIGPVIECSAKGADKQPCKMRYWADEAPEECTKCGSTLKRQKPKRIKCPVCGGRKTRIVQETEFSYDYKISEVAGAIIDDKQHTWGSLGVKYIIPTLHPAALLRQSAGAKDRKKVAGGQFMAKPVQKHIRKALLLAKQDREFVVPFEVTDGDNDLDAANHLQEYIYRDGIYEVSADIETEAWNEDRTEQLDARELHLVTDIKCIGFGSRAKGYALVVDTRNVGYHLKRALKQVLEDPRIRKTFHHGNYDVPVIYKVWGLKVRGYTDDTLIQHHILFPDEPHNLAHVAFSYTYARMWKPPKTLKGHEAHETFADLAKYNARDAMLTDEIRVSMDESLARKNRAGLYKFSGETETKKPLSNLYKFDMGLQEQALAMHFNGMSVSQESAQDVGDEAFVRYCRSLARMRDILKVPDWNPKSAPQLRWALFQKLGFPSIAKTDGGAESTATYVIKRLPDSPFKYELLEFYKALDVLKAYYDKPEDDALGEFLRIDLELDSRSKNIVIPSKGLHIWPDGKIRGSWGAKARTGRFVSSPNCQNWPKWMRALVKARKGRKFVGADMDQLELRLIAALSGDEMLIRKCLEADDSRKLEPEWDPHSYVASFAFGRAFLDLDIDDPTHDKKNDRCRCQKCQRKALRDLCKRVIYGLNYGAGDDTVLDSIYEGGYEGPPITLQMIAKVRMAIYKAFRRIPIWREQQVKLAYANGYVASPLLDRRRYFPLNEIPVTEIYNYPIQAGGADIVNLRGTEVFNNIGKIDRTSEYFAQVHDAIYYDVDEMMADVVCQFVTKTLTWTTPMFKGGPEMRFSAKAEKHDNWKGD